MWLDDVITAMAVLVLLALVTIVPVHIRKPARLLSMNPSVTRWIVLVNIAVYLLMIIGTLLQSRSLITMLRVSWIGGQSFYETVIQTRGVVPFEILHGVDLPPPNGLGIIGVYLNIFTSMFLHGGLAHLLSNIIFFWIFGPQTETCFNIDFDRRFRPRNSYWQFVLVYLLCGIGAVLVYSVFNADSTSVLIGASGAISGVLGASAVLLWKEYRKMEVLIFYSIPVQIQANLYMLFWIVTQVALQLLFGQWSPIAYLAHIGGFLTGVILAYARDALNPHKPFGMGI